MEVSIGYTSLSPGVIVKKLGAPGKWSIFMHSSSRSKQPQHGSFPVSHTRQQCLHIGPVITWIYTWNAGVLNY